MRKVEGVSEVNADKDKHEVTLVFDSNTVSRENIKEKFEASGFIVEKMEVTPR